jgi:CheY-like chemotaxis protein
VAAGVAHDLNNILTIVIGETELIEGESHSASAPVRASLRLIRASTARAAQITQSLLLIARGAPAAAPCRAPSAVLREVAETVLRTLPDGVTLTCELAADSDVPVAIGTSQLYQVALNLLVNARDAVGAHGSIVLRSQLAVAPPTVEGRPERGVCISVVDTGAGIDAETMQHLFEPFFTTKNTGHGLGLATAYGLVRACGGELTVESQVAVGSEFALWLPEVPASAVPAVTAAACVEAAPAATTARPTRVAGTQVLLCDDDPMLLQALSRALRDLGYDVTQARSLVSACAAWRRDPTRYQLVVTDLRLGQERGLELVRQVLAERSNVHVVVMSGDMQGPDRDDPVWRQVTCLQKPFNREALRVAVSVREQS